MKALLWKEMLQLVRSYRLLITCSVFGFFGLSSPLLARYAADILRAVGNTGNLVIEITRISYLDAASQYMKNISQIGVLLLIYLNMGAVASEREADTAAFVLVKPVSRRSFFVSKLLAQAFSATIGLLVAAVGAWIYTDLLFANAPAGAFVGLNLLLWVYLLTMVAVTLLFSTLLESAVAAGVAAFLFWIFSMALSAVPAVAPYLPASLLTDAMGLMEGRPPGLSAVAASILIIVAATVGGVMALKRGEY